MVRIHAGALVVATGVPDLRNQFLMVMLHAEGLVGALEFGIMDSF